MEYDGVWWDFDGIEWDVIHVYFRNNQQYDLWFGDANKDVCLETTKFPRWEMMTKPLIFGCHSFGQPHLVVA